MLPCASWFKTLAITPDTEGVIYDRLIALLSSTKAGKQQLASLSFYQKEDYRLTEAPACHEANLKMSGGNGQILQ